MFDMTDSNGEGSRPQKEAKPEVQSSLHGRGRSAGSWLRGNSCAVLEGTACKGPATRASGSSANATHAETSSGSTSTGSSSAQPPQDLEQKFEDEFTRHLKKSNRNAKWALTGIGAGIGGALALAAAPLTIPGMVAAAVVGSAAGHQLGRHHGEKRLQMNGRISAEAASQRPSLRRLRFLVKWGYWQLLEYENEAPEWQGTVVGEVVRAFSPWVQAMFLLRARAPAGIEEGDAEAQEIFQHLAPLYHWLQRSTTFQALVGVVHAVDIGFQRGSVQKGYTELYTDLCRIVFTTVLETISIMDRLAPSTHEKLRKDKASPFAEENQAPQRMEFLKTQRRKRLRATVDSIQQVLARTEVQDVLAGRRKLGDAVEQEMEEADEILAPTDSPRESVSLVVPPEGVEEEADVDSQNSSENGSDADFQSCGDASDVDFEGTASGPSRPTTRRSLSRSYSGSGPQAKDGTDGPRKEKFHRRLAACSRGGGDHQWDSYDASNFRVRSATYLKDRVKAPSAPSMLDLVNIDYTIIGTDGPVWHTAMHRDFYPMHHRRNGDERFLFILNLIVPPVQAVIVGALDPHAPWLLDDSTPQARVWRRLLAMSPEDQKNAFKVIVSIVDGPWLVKRAVPTKPVLIGKVLQMQTRSEPGEYFELTLDLASLSRPEQAIVGMVLRALTRLELAISLLIEGNTEDELPETLLVCARMKGLDIKRWSSPDESLE